MDRAKHLQDARLEAVRSLAESRARVAKIATETERELADLQREIATRVGNAEKADLKAYNAAITAGWSTDDLTKIGFAEPAKVTRVRRRSTAKTTTE